MTQPENQNSDPIREALRQLPRVAASEDFNKRLLDRANAAEARPSITWPRLAAAAAFLALAAGAVFVAREQNQRLDYQRKRAALELRHDELRRDLAAVRERAVRSPRLYLGASPDVDLVLDLEPWMAQPVGAQPAAYTTSRP